ncbi:MAG: phage tail protein [Rickettsiales bacterium]|nr:phage tail protein [Rickettsiales bacterium]
MSRQPWSPGLASTTVGVIEGIVVDNKDPEGIGRILVQYPWLPNETKSAWARLATPMAGKEMGLVIYPEKDDEVLLDFVNGNVNTPVIIGSLFNGKEKPPFDNADGENNIRTFVSRSGHVIEVDDKSGSEKITITDKSGGLVIEMDSSKETITITSKGDINIKADSNFKVEAKDIEMKAGSNATFKAGSALEASAGSSATVQGGSGVTVKGATVSLN